MLSTLDRYQRIARFYDVLDAPFERRRYAFIRPMLFEGLSGHILDAGVGTGRNIAYYPTAASMVGIDFSTAMLAVAEQRRARLSRAVDLRRMDVTRLEFDEGAFDAAVATFLFCVLADDLQVPALRELGRVVKPGGQIRLLEYVRPKGRLRRASARLWEPWMAFAYGAGFDRHTEERVPEAGLRVKDSRFVVDDLVKLISVVRIPDIAGATASGRLPRPATSG